MIYLPDPLYNPELVSDENLNSKTKLSKGVTVGKFFVNTGSFFDYDNMTYAKRLEIAKNLYLQAEAMKVMNLSYGPFKDYRLVVSEGLYQPDESLGETLSEGSINFLRNKGRAIVYELYDKDGNIDIDNTFEFAVYAKDNLRFSKLILDYDKYESTLHACIILVMPQIKDGYEMTFSQEIQTQFNNTIQTTGEFVETKG